MSSHSTVNSCKVKDNSEKNNTKSTEKPKRVWRFDRSFELPPNILELLKNSKITSTDILLMSVIEAMTRNSTNHLGCFMSNGYLADAIGGNKTYVSDRIAHLEHEGFLLIVWLNGKRYLELEWTRPAEERAELEGEYGEELRRQYQKLLDRLEQNKKLSRFRKNPKGSEKTEPPLRKKPNPPSEKTEHNYKDKDKKREIKEIHCPQPPSAGGQSTVNSNLNGKSKNHNSSSNGKPILPILEKKELSPARKLAIQLYDGLNSKKVLGRNFPKQENTGEVVSKKWQIWFSRLLDNGLSFEEIQKTIKDYIPFIGVDEYVPQGYSGESFYKKYDSIVREIKKRMKGKELVDGRKTKRERGVDLVWYGGEWIRLDEYNEEQRHYREMDRQIEEEKKRKARDMETDDEEVPTSFECWGQGEPDGDI